MASVVSLRPFSGVANTVVDIDKDELEVSDIPDGVGSTAAAAGGSQLDVPAGFQEPGARPSRVSTQNSPKVFQFIKAGTEAACLSWKGLSFSVNARKARKTILDNVTGQLKPGDLTCILGPSGSGKTSLLNLLAGRCRRGGRSGAELEGEVLVNSRAIVPSNFQHLFGYVMQDDALLGTMTPREVLQFSAHLRLNNVDHAQRGEVLDDLLSSLGLQKCADTMVGNELIKGISGGERKRTAVGAELITNPQVTFLDEPTSGLDAAAAYNVICVLKELTKLRQSVMCSIHQPSSEVFHLFDQAIFVCQGRVAYQGPPSSIRKYFSGLSYNLPEDYNPADYVMFLIGSDRDDQEVTKIMNAWRPAELQLPSQDTDLPPVPKRKGFIVEVMALSRRDMKNLLRDKQTLGARFGTTIFLTLLFSLVFFQLGNVDGTDNFIVSRDGYELQSHMGAVTMLAITGMFAAAQPLLLTFASERPVFMREKACNTYGVFPYFISKTVTEIPIVMAQVLALWLIAYWLIGMNGSFMTHYIAMLLNSLVAASTALFAGCCVADAKQAMEVAPGLFVPQIIFSGFFIKMELVPSFLRWLQYICSLKWAMNILLINEFEDMPGGREMLDANDATDDSKFISYIVLVVLFCLFRLAAMCVLSHKAKAFYN